MFLSSQSEGAGFADTLFRQFAPEKDMQSYGRGIRRRLAPMLRGDRKRLELAYSLMFSLPGAPVLRYGDEIGMGDDLSLEERLSVRTPMQWSDQSNAGFSQASPEKLVRPVVTEGEFGYRQVNVAQQRRDMESLLAWMEHLIRVRRECPEIGSGRCKILDCPEPGLVVHRCEWESGAVIVVHNLADRPATVHLELDAEKGERLVELLGQHAPEPVQGQTELRIEGYGYRWYRVAGAGWKLP